MLEDSDRYKATVKGYEDSYYGHPVKIEALNIYWMVSSNYNCHGKRLLDEIESSGKMHYYNLTSVQLIIEYVYGVVFSEIKKYFIPNFIDLAFTVIQIAIFHELFTNEVNFSTDIRKE